MSTACYVMALFMFLAASARMPLRVDPAPLGWFFLTLGLLLGRL